MSTSPYCEELRLELLKLGKEEAKKRVLVEYDCQEISEEERDTLLALLDEKL